MKELMAKLMKSKSKDEEPQDKLDARRCVLEELRDEMKSIMKEALADGLKKVSVAADSKEGLKEGLDKAKEIVESGPEGLASEEPGEDKAEEMSEASSEELEEEPAELDDEDAKQRALKRFLQKA